MSKIKTIQQARDYANRIKNFRSFNKIDILEVAGSLDVLGRFGDDENYRKVVDSFVKLAKRKNGLKLNENPLSYLELLLTVADGNQNYYHPFRELKTEKPPVGDVQKYFNKLYGEHLYSK